MRSAPPSLLVWATLLVATFASGARADAPIDSLPTPALGTPQVRAWQTGVLRPDRLQHASLSFALGLGAGLATDSPAAGAGIALGFGVAKETLDRGGSGFDGVDLVADAIGAGLAAWAAGALRR